MTEPENALAHVEATQDMVVVLDALSRVADATSTAGVRDSLPAGQFLARGRLNLSSDCTQHGSPPGCPCG
jgi:transcription termination factor Rho